MCHFQFVRQILEDMEVRLETIWYLNPDSCPLPFKSVAIALYRVPDGCGPELGNDFILNLRPGLDHPGHFDLTYVILNKVGLELKLVNEEILSFLQQIPTLALDWPEA